MKASLIAFVTVLGCADLGERIPPTVDSLATAVGSTEPARSKQDVAAAAFASVVLLVIHDADGQPLSMGTGFFADDSVVVTNYHVVAGGTGGFAKSLNSDEQTAIEGILAMDPARDIALLRVPKTAPSMQLSTGPIERVGSTVYAIGNPQGLEGTFSEGIVSALRPIGSDTILQITAPISPGSSGGPVLNAEGNVVGVATATYRGGQNLNFAIPVKFVAEALRRQELVLFGRLAASDESVLSSIGERATAGVVGESIQWEGRFDFQSGYTFSLRNKSNQAVRNVYALVIFRDQNGNAIETDPVHWQDIIPAGLARRVSSKVDPSVKRLTTRELRVEYAMSPWTKVEIRIISFDIAE